VILDDESDHTHRNYVNFAQDLTSAHPPRRLHRVESVYPTGCPVHLRSSECPLELRVYIYTNTAIKFRGSSVTVVYRRGVGISEGVLFPGEVRFLSLLQRPVWFWGQSSLPSNYVSTYLSSRLKRPKHELSTRDFSADVGNACRNAQSNRLPNVPCMPIKISA
jgi:hypothetical protein